MAEIKVLSVSEYPKTNPDRWRVRVMVTTENGRKFFENLIPIDGTSSMDEAEIVECVLDSNSIRNIKDAVYDSETKELITPEIKQTFREEIKSFIESDNETVSMTGRTIEI